MLTQFLRFKDLKAKGIVSSWPALRYKIRNNGFPVGRLLGPNTRAWTVEEVQRWLDGLPTQPSRLRGRKAETHVPEAA